MDSQSIFFIFIIKTAIMMMRRLCVAVPTAIVMYPRKAYAQQVKASYREHFAKLNATDEKIVRENYKRELTKKFGYPKIIASLDNNTINELYYIHVMYSKPLSAERRIRLRTLLLPFLEDIDEKEKHELFVAIAKYYDIL